MTFEEFEDMSFEERSKVSKEIGELAMKQIREENFALNLPIVYMNENRDIVREYKDGTIVVIGHVGD